VILLSQKMQAVHQKDRSEGDVDDSGARWTTMLHMYMSLKVEDTYSLGINLYMEICRL
jgi:hypothetical protein